MVIFSTKQRFAVVLYTIAKVKYFKYFFLLFVIAIRMLDEDEDGTESTTASALTHKLDTYHIYSNSWGYVTEGKTYVYNDMEIEAIEKGIAEVNLTMKLHL